MDSEPHLADPLDGLLGYQLRRLTVLIMADLAEALAPLQLRPTEACALFVIGAAAGLTQSEVGRALGIQRANMAPLMAGLMSRGFVTREKVDGRSQALALTAAGAAASAAAWALTQAHEERFFSRLSPGARAMLAGEFRALWQA
jgi:DNA-binding MarR family transcriptional regulator